MIPPSYLFKNLYSETWEEPEPRPLPAENQTPRNGRKIPLLSAVVSYFSRTAASRGTAIRPLALKHGQ